MEFVKGSAFVVYCEECGKQVEDYVKIVNPSTVICYECADKIRTELNDFFNNNPFDNNEDIKVEFKLDAEQLESMPYNNLRKLASEMAIDSKGSKAEIIDRILAEKVIPIYDNPVDGVGEEP